MSPPHVLSSLLVFAAVTFGGNVSPTSAGSLVSMSGARKLAGLRKLLDPDVNGVLTVTVTTATGTFDAAFTVSGGYFTGLVPSYYSYVNFASVGVNIPLTFNTYSVRSAINGDVDVISTSPFLTHEAATSMTIPSGESITLELDTDSRLSVHLNLPFVLCSEHAFIGTVPASSITFVPTPTTPQLLGCYDDYHVHDADTVQNPKNNDDWDLYTGSWMKIGRNFPYAHVLHTTNSIATCAAVAQASGSVAFGMSKGSECWFGDATTTYATTDVLSHKMLDISACDATCSGDQTTKCGSMQGAISVYEI